MTANIEALQPTSLGSPGGVGAAGGIGLATLSRHGVVLDAWFPAPQIIGDGAVGVPTSRPRGLTSSAGGCLGDVVEIHTCIDDLARPPVDACDAYLRLHLLSHRVIRPHQANLAGIEELLADVVWTSRGPVAVEDYPSVRTSLRAQGPFTVNGVGKIPRMVDYAVPSGIRIADGARVQLGAHLAPGTTVMPEGFVDYNAGTLGAAIIEGQVATGVVIGDGSDMGGGSGGVAVSIGRRCLIGANAEVEISLGDDCVVDSGLHVAPDTVLTREDGSTVAACALAGADNLHLRRSSVSGAVEVRRWDGAGVRLNTELLAND
jgi:2,3,4,5-tetrahydropyridine-2,6-dicarboxylate N-succinyltransferase